MAVPPLPSSNGILKNDIARTYSGKPVTETLTNGFFSVNRQWTVKYWNKAAEKLLGVPAADIIGKNLWEHFAGILPLEFYTVYYKAFLEDSPVHFEEYWGEMGSWFDVITYYCDETLSVSFKSSNHPNSEYPENTVQRLKTLTELYKFVTEITNDCLWEWDIPNKEMFWIDGGHKRVLGYQIENALIPQSFWENCIHPGDKERVLTRLKKIIHEGSECIWEDEYRFKKANGDYAYVNDRAHIIYEEDKVASRMIGATQDITDRVLLEKKLALEMQTKQNEITAAVLTAQENERTEIGRELHDNLNQTLAVAKLYIQMAKKPGPEKNFYLDKSCDLLTDVIGEIRRISKNLVIPGTHIIGLFDNINNLVHELTGVHPIKIEFLSEGFKDDELDEKLQLTIFRIIQEQMTNILKHARASHSTISLRKAADEIILVITDNGEGCDLLKEKKGVGIINIKSRVALFHGTVVTLSKPGEGFVLEVALPLGVSI
ncbi:MAG: PAS domain-containing protein [Ferruginibacter sp.]|nr:PAS domain-containing protein [Chitinophagaceae bacterium]